MQLNDSQIHFLHQHWIKTFSREGVFDAQGLEWAKQKAPQLLTILEQPLNLF